MEGDKRMKPKIDRACASFRFLGIGMLAVAAILAAHAAAAPRGSDMKVNAKVKAPDIIAVRVRHDMCPLCKELDPKFPEIIRNANDESVLFVTLDLTDQYVREFDQKQSHEEHTRQVGRAHVHECPRAALAGLIQIFAEPALLFERIPTTKQSPATAPRTSFPLPTPKNSRE